MRLNNLFRCVCCIAFWFFCSYAAVAQLTIQNGAHVIEINGRLSTYYNHRFLKPTNNNRDKDRFKLRDAQLQIEGRVKDIYEYELQVDFVDLATFGSQELDPENPGLMEARFRYKGLRWVDIELGYGKTYYSRSSLVPFIFTPYWQRAELVRGNIFGRRDVGITFIKSLWKQRINMYGGVYTGLNELSLKGDNDASGRPEYVGRVDIAYPSRYRYRDIDNRVTPIPMFALGLNARYTDKSLPSGNSFPEFATGEYGIKVIDGERLMYGLDIAFQYMGFSASFEIHQLKGTPQFSDDPLLRGFNVDQTGGGFFAGGWVSQMNYFSKPLKSIFSVRLEELDLNDLVIGNSRRFSAAYAYQLKGFDSMIKVQYFNILTEESIDTKRWAQQVRIGWQYNFN